jgi:cytochrome c
LRRKNENPGLAPGFFVVTLPQIPQRFTMVKAALINLRHASAVSTTEAGRMPRIFAVLAIILLSALSWAASAAEFGTRDEAVAMVKRAQAMFKTKGAEATFKAVSDPADKDFHDRDLYVFIYDMKGLNLAHGARPALIGKNLIDLKDQDGKYLIREMIDIAKGPGNGWINYKWPNPLTNKIEDKASYIELMGDYFVGVGIYRQ